MQMAYRDMRQYLDVLKEHGKLSMIDAEVDKDWEISAVCRAIFTDIADDERPAVMFRNITGFSTPIVAGILGGSRSIYGLAMETEPERIMERWRDARAKPIPPVLVESGPCKENVLIGDDADLTKFPWPVWTVEHDAGAYVTSGYVITKDVRTGERNVGTYRQQIKGPRKTGMQIGVVHDGHRHIKNNEAVGEATPIAIVVGADPVIGLCSVSNFPPGVDELSVAGGVRGEPIELVKCSTIDLEVPATAEFVIEGEILPREREREGPFGEFTGYMSPPGQHFVVRVTAITHRNDPILQAFISQMPPSESSTIRGTAHDQALLYHLKEVLRLPVTDVHCYYAGGTDAYVVVSIDKKRGIPGVAKQVLFAVWSYEPRQGKIAVVVDDDIDVRDSFMVNWALSFRMQPAEDVILVPSTAAVANDPSTAPFSVEHHLEARLIGSKMGIDATKKFEFPPVAMPPREHIEQVRAQWDRYQIGTSKPTVSLPIP